MCHQNSCRHVEEKAASGEENLLLFCKPVELYNILHARSRENPSFLRRCLSYKIQEKRKRRLTSGTVVFNYRDYNNVLQKTEVTENFSCPFCSLQCASFKGLRYHLCSSHDLFNFEFWEAEDYQAVNISVMLRSEIVTGGPDVPDHRLQTFYFCSKPRRRRPKNLNQKHVNVQFLQIDSPKLPTEDQHQEITDKDDVENACTLLPREKKLPIGIETTKSNGFDTAERIEDVASSFNIPGVSIAMAQSSVDPECGKLSAGNDAVAPVLHHIAKSRKLSADRSELRNRALLHKRQFYHSHRVQPMAMEQVMSDQDSEDEVDDDIAGFEDRRMLDDFVDVSKDEKQLMHLWNSFVRKQRVLADGHVPWACEAFSKLHAKELVHSPALFWCWRLFMIKLWNHGLLDGCTMNNCNSILEKYQEEATDDTKN